MKAIILIDSKKSKKAYSENDNGTLESINLIQNVSFKLSKKPKYKITFNNK